jgi:hypothetical protein
MKIEDVFELLKEIGIVKQDQTELTDEFYARWKKLEIALTKRGPIEKEWADQGVTYSDSARVAAIVSFAPTGLKPETTEQAYNITQAFIDRIPSAPKGSPVFKS